jgi:hypothetical protein
MAVFRAQIATAQDSLFPSDRIMITPHFETTSGQDYEALAEEIAIAWDTYTGTLNEITVKIYDALDTTPPAYPLAEYVMQPGVAGAATVNRDAALCLSFYAGVNRPRYRGRIYVPLSLIGISPGAARPTTPQMQRAADLVPVLRDIGDASVNWCVYSRVDGVGRPVTNWWVDNNWDSQRRRGTKPTARLEGTTTA